MQNRVTSCLFSFAVEFANGYKMGWGGRKTVAPKIPRVVCLSHPCQGGNSWGGGLGGPQPPPPPQLLANNTFFVFSHTTARKVPSEVVLMGSFMSVRYGNVR